MELRNFISDCLSEIFETVSLYQDMIVDERTKLMLPCDKGYMNDAFGLY